MSCFMYYYMFIVPGQVRNLMKTASSASSITISWDPPEPSDGYTNISVYIIRYGVLDTTGEIVTSENTQETINNLRTYNHCTLYTSMYTHLIFQHIYVYTHRTGNTILRCCVS